MHIEILIPGLFAVPGRHLAGLREVAPDQLFEQCLRTAGVEPSVAGRYAALSQWLACNNPPIAALQWCALSEDSLPRQPAMLSPVHFQAGMDDLVMLPPAMLDLDDAERAALIDEMQAFFGDEPRMMSAAGKWFIDLAELDITTVPLHAAIGKSVRSALPRGLDATRVNAWLNELQMFLHSSAVNSRRQAHGSLTVNGGWIWGEGNLPADVPSRLRNAIFAGKGEALSLAQGLSAFAGGEYSESGFPIDETQRSIYIIDTRLAETLDADSPESWSTRRDDIIKQWIKPAFERWKNGKVSSVRLHGGDGRLREWRSRGLMARLKQLLHRAPAALLAEEDAGSE